MDAYVQVALIEKSRRVFATDAGNFLSFPLLSPLTFKPQELASLSTPATTADYIAAANFARIVNFIPRDLVASSGDDAYLWDIYADVLARADVANSNAQAPAAGSGNGSLLWDIAADGTRSESAVYRTYRQYRDAWIIAQEDYGAQKLTGESSDDPAVKQHWTDVVEPALRAAIAQASANLDTLGRRAEVEAAVQAERDATLHDPRSRWQEWVNAFNPDIDLLTDAGGHYAPSGLSPTNFIDQGAWLHFELSASEMAGLVQSAPPQLKVVLDESSGSTVEHVSFDYRSVAVVRPWFQGNALTSRIWRSNDPQLSLSDGGDPATGVCPGYVSAVVFVRNVRITSRATGPATTAPVVNTELRFTLKADRLTARTLKLSDAVPQKLVQQAQPTSANVVRAFSKLNQQSFVVAAAPSATLRAAIAPAKLNLVERSTVASKIRGTAVGAVIRAQPVQANPAPAPAPAPPPPAPQDDIAILAFICKRLPKTPDPTPELRWL